MMPRLQAEEKLDAINVGALSSGDVDRAYRMRAIGALQRKTLGHRFRAKKAGSADLAGMGIGMRTAPVTPPEMPLSDVSGACDG